MSKTKMERETQERFREEEAELKRSTKKVKDSHPSFGDGSFKDKLLGDLPGAYAQAFRFNPLEEDETFSNTNWMSYLKVLLLCASRVSIKLGLEVDGLLLLVTITWAQGC